VNEREAYINYRYSAALITETTGFKDETLRDFMQKSRPSYQWLRKNTADEDIRYYINDQLKNIQGNKLGFIKIRHDS